MILNLGMITYFYVKTTHLPQFILIRVITQIWTNLASLIAAFAQSRRSVVMENKGWSFPSLDCESRLYRNRIWFKIYFSGRKSSISVSLTSKQKDPVNKSRDRWFTILSLIVRSHCSIHYNRAVTRGCRV